MTPDVPDRATLAQLAPRLAERLDAEAWRFGRGLIFRQGVIL
ncbi:hypothetical protein [Aeromonas sanarellii]